MQVAFGSKFETEMIQQIESAHPDGFEFCDERNDAIATILLVAERHTTFEWNTVFDRLCDEFPAREEGE